MESLISLSSAALLVSLNLLLLNAALSYLGKKDDALAPLKGGGLLLLKLALLAFGLRLISWQPWFEAPFAALGIALPIIAMVLIMGRKKI